MRTFLLSALFAATLAAQTPIRGFPPRLAGEQRALEDKARALPDPARARQYMKRMTAVPHAAGQPGSKAVAEYALGLFRQWGLEADIEEFEALLPYPTFRRLEMIAPVRYLASLREPVIPQDPDSGDAGQLPVYNAYAASGDVTAPLVYVNYGLPDDYAALKKLGVDPRGKIVIARYGKSWRGTKVKVAQENGAVACLIYSDPKDDGYFAGDAYPKGPYRPARSAQRGSLMDMPLYVGDPLSPGWASVKGARRLPREQAANIMKIPALPISHAEARPLLANLGGPVVPETWRGALPLTYHAGPGPARVRLKVDFDWTSKPLYNVIARIPGSVLPDEWVIYGNHHDAWVNGANDPTSGAVALLETARALAQLRSSGWRPRRTIVFALWDAEEFGLVGSTEWVEQHRGELTAKAVAYLNSDSNFGGKLRAGGSPTLDVFLRQVLGETNDPVEGRTVLEVAAGGDDGGEQEKKAEFKVGVLGAGSDYVAFVHHAGIASLNLGFSKPGSDGVYHSIYDSFTWYTRFGDKNFLYAKALAQVQATALLRLAEAPVLPFEFQSLHRAIREYLEDLEKDKSNEFAAVRAELEHLGVLAKRYEELLSARADSVGAKSAQPLAALNRLLASAERALTLEDGLPGRPWYRHQLYAPGLYTGYSAKTLPGIREAKEAGRTELANEQARRLAATLRNFNRHLEQMTALLGEF